MRDTKELAACYARLRDFQERRGQELFALAAARPGEIALDLGCGTGELSLELARQLLPGGCLVAVDPDQARLNIATKAASQGDLDITFVQACGEDLETFEDDRFDLIYSNYAVHWIRDMPAFLCEASRVMKPAGRLVFECVGEPIKCLVDLLQMMPDFADIVQENTFQSEAAWRSQIAAAGLTVERLDWPERSMSFPDRQTFFSWFEATTMRATGVPQ